VDHLSLLPGYRGPSEGWWALMLRRSGLPAPVTPLPQGSGRLRLLLLVPLVLLIAGGATGLLNHTRGWVMFGLACAALFMLARHRSGGPAWLARMLGEYAVVAVLAVLLVTGTGIAKPALPGGQGRTAAGAAQLCPPTLRGVAASACDLASDLWAKTKAAAKAKANQQASPTTTRPHRP
jgi:hypothetical protein